MSQTHWSTTIADLLLRHVERHEKRDKEGTASPRTPIFSPNQHIAPVSSIAFKSIARIPSNEGLDHLAATATEQTVLNGFFDGHASHQLDMHPVHIGAGLVENEANCSATDEMRSSDDLFPFAEPWSSIGTSSNLSAADFQWLFCEDDLRLPSHLPSPTQFPSPTDFLSPDTVTSSSVRPLISPHQPSINQIVFIAVAARTCNSVSS